MSLVTNDGRNGRRWIAAHETGHQQTDRSWKGGKQLPRPFLRICRLRQWKWSPHHVFGCQSKSSECCWICCFNSSPFWVLRRQISTGGRITLFSQSSWECWADEAFEGLECTTATQIESAERWSSVSLVAAEWTNHNWRPAFNCVRYLYIKPVAIEWFMAACDICSHEKRDFWSWPSKCRSTCSRWAKWFVIPSTASFLIPANESSGWNYSDFRAY